MTTPTRKLLAFTLGAVAVGVMVTVGMVFWKDIYCQIFLDPRLVGKWKGPNIRYLHGGPTPSFINGGWRNQISGNENLEFDQAGNIRWTWINDYTFEGGSYNMGNIFEGSYCINGDSISWMLRQVSGSDIYIRGPRSDPNIPKSINASYRIKTNSLTIIIGNSTRNYKRDGQSRTGSCGGRLNPVPIPTPGPEAGTPPNFPLRPNPPGVRCGYEAEAHETSRDTSCCRDGVSRRRCAIPLLPAVASAASRLRHRHGCRNPAEHGRSAVAAEPAATFLFNTGPRGD